MNYIIEVNKVKDFYKNIENDKNHRYRSWEHCFNYFLKPKEEIEVDKACLHLSFYLASWGMYRGSSYLLQKDYLIHKILIEKVILSPKYRVLQTWDFINNNKENVTLLLDLKVKIKEHYAKEIIKSDGNKFTASDILITKIILGTFGCVPAYDRFFIYGLKLNQFDEFVKKFNTKFGFSFTDTSFNNLIKVYEANQKSIDKLSNEQRFDGKKYPIMKIIDMYFWQLGFDQSVKDEEEKKRLKALEKLQKKNNG